MADAMPQPERDMAAILRVASYNRADHELPVVSVHHKRHDAVRTSLFQAFGLAQTLDLGALGRLPFEIISMICLSLDVKSALRFSHVNRTAREVLSAIRELRHLRATALEPLCVLLRTNLASHMDVSTLYAALNTQKCALCPAAFGGFFFLPTATRCCLTCIASSPETQVTHVSRLADAANVPAATLARQIPVLHTLPDSRKRIVSAQHARAVLAATGMPASAVERTIAHFPDSLTLRFQAATSLPYVDRATGTADSGVSCKGCQVAFERDFSDEHLELRDRFYSRAGFAAHFEECEEAGRLWEDSQGGSVKVKEPKWVGLGRTFTPASGRGRCGRRESEGHLSD